MDQRRSRVRVGRRLPTLDLPHQLVQPPLGLDQRAGLGSDGAPSGTGRVRSGRPI